MPDSSCLDLAAIDLADGGLGYIHSVDSGAAVDGPGMRFAFFLSGCCFRCCYCHNPDTWKLRNGRLRSLEQSLDELAPYAGFLRMAGGVTVSGGEPLVQAAFAGRLLGAAKERFGLHTALDTQGFLHTRVEDAWFDPVDLVLLDIKHADPLAYERLTGRPLQPTLDFARRLVRLGKPLWIRYVAVPGVTDAAEDVDRLAAFLAELGPAVQRVEVLPFHQLGRAKWQRLGLRYPLAETPTPTAEQVERVRDGFRAHGLTVR